MNWTPGNLKTGRQFFLVMDLYLQLAKLNGILPRSARWEKLRKHVECGLDTGDFQLAFEHIEELRGVVRHVNERTPSWPTSIENLNLLENLLRDIEDLMKDRPPRKA